MGHNQRVSGNARFAALITLAVFLAVSVFSLRAQQAGSRLSIAAATVSSPVRLDGVLDEPAWQEAAAVELVQQAPQPGGPTPYRTTFRVIVHNNRIYFGLECVDPDPNQISVHTMRRDVTSEGDDTLSVVLDTYGDRRTGYFFRVNAAGARSDGLISGPERARLDWDGIWDARVARTPGGWSAEIEIPANTLNFTRNLSAWGVNLERNIGRDRTVLRWSSATLDSSLYDLSRAGTLSGVGELKQGHGIEVSPFLVGKMQADLRNPSRVWLGQPGADVTWRIAPQVAAVFTFNTDFAETEVDSRRLNITRFPLFFPEKRSFFLEGANQFDFGSGLEQQFIPFFSRNIGLNGGVQIPIDAGFKLNGRAGKWNIGLLDVETRDKYSPVASAVVPRTNLFAGRASYDFTRKLRVGSILTHGSPDGIHNNTLAGFDGVWRTSELFGNKNFVVAGWTAFSSGDATRGNHTGYGFLVDYPNDLLDCFTSLTKIGRAHV